MNRLDVRDVAALMDVVAELEQLDDEPAVPPRVIELLQRLIPSDFANYSELDPIRRCSRLQVGRGADGEEEVVEGQSEDEREAAARWWELRSSHPLCSRRVATGEWCSVRKVSDFATLRDFRRTEIYDAYYRGKLNYWFDFGLPAEPDRTRVFIFTRLDRDFTERDRLVAELVRPHLEARAVRAERAVRMAAELADVGRTEAEEPAVILCTAGGLIEFASISARALLRRYLRIENGRVPIDLFERPETTFVDGHAALTTRVVRNGARRLIFLEERDRRLERLTPRETQILGLVTQGHENDAIAWELGIASATVAKHLEHVYEKLGVHNRTAAAILAKGAGTTQEPAER